MNAPTELRLFVAIDLVPELRQAVGAAVQRVRRTVTERLRAARTVGDPMKWVAVPNLHLTLKFLGETPTHVLADIDEAVAQAAAVGQPFDLSVGELGAFPNAGRPRVVWLGVRAPEKPARTLRRALDDRLAALGFAREVRPFAPHLTIARLRDVAPPEEVRAVGEAIRRHPVGELGAQPVDRIALVRSELFPSGPRYTALQEYELGTGRRLVAVEAEPETPVLSTERRLS